MLPASYGELINLSISVITFSHFIMVPSCLSVISISCSWPASGFIPNNTMLSKTLGLIQVTSRIWDKAV